MIKMLELTNPKYTTQINKTEILDRCISETKSKTFFVLLFIFVFTLIEWALYLIHFKNENTKQRILEYVITIRNVMIIVLFSYELFFTILY